MYSKSFFEGNLFLFRIDANDACKHQFYLHFTYTTDTHATMKLEQMNVDLNFIKIKLSLKLEDEKNTEKECKLIKQIHKQTNE